MKPVTETTELSDADYVREFKLQAAMEIIPEVREKNERLERIANYLEGITCPKKPVTTPMPNECAQAIVDAKGTRQTQGGAETALSPLECTPTEKLWAEIVLWNNDPAFPDDQLKQIIKRSLDDAFENGRKFA